MTTIEIIDRIPTGGVVPKKVLWVLKQQGLIDSYSTFGYLDGNNPIGLVEYKGRWFECKYFDGCFKPYLIKSKRTPHWNIQTNSTPVRTEYLQFKADYKRETNACGRSWWFDNLYYLREKVLLEKYGSEYYRTRKYLDWLNGRFECADARVNVSVNHRMVLWGAVC